MMAPGELAPAFRLPLLGGGDASLEDLTARGPVLLFFFKLGCGTTDLAAPFVQKLADEFLEHESAEGTLLSVLAVSQEKEAGAEQFRSRSGVRLPVAIDTDLAVSRRFDIEATPTLVLLRGAEKLRADAASVAVQEALRITDVVEGWSRAAMEQLGEEIAARVGAVPPEIFAGRSDVPESQPG